MTLSWWPGYTIPAKFAFYSLSVMASGQVVREGDQLSLDDAWRLKRPYFPTGPGRVSAATLAQLRGLILREGFFELSACYGCIVDFDARMIEVDLDGRRHRVGFLKLDDESVPLTRAQAILRLWYGALAAITKHDPAEFTDAGDARILARKR